MPFGLIRQWAQSLLFGFDYFISYRHSDGAEFAQSLFHGLRRRGFDCFLDRQHYAAGHLLRRMQALALRRSTALLVVTTADAIRDRGAGETDWLLSEIQQFRQLHPDASRSPIVPIGTPETLSRRRNPGSALLAELPSLDDHAICVLDAGVASRGGAAEATLEKLETDFRQRRRRFLRLLVAGGLVAAAVVALVLAQLAQQRRRQVQDELSTTRALDQVAVAAGQFSRPDPVLVLADLRSSREQLIALGRVPLLADFGLAAVRTRSLAMRELAEVPEGVDEMRLSADGDWLFVRMDYTAPNGDPDIETIPDQLAFGVLHVPTASWSLRRNVGSSVGRLVYTLDRGGLLGFEPPDHLLIQRSAVDGEGPQRLALDDGRMAPVSAPAAAAAAVELDTLDLPTGVKSRIVALLDPANLYLVDPHDGIDLEYGPRRVTSTVRIAPNRRSAIAGTYEGRLMLVDLVNGRLAGDTRFDTVFDAVYRDDSRRAYVATGRSIVEIDTGLPAGVHALSLAPVPRGDKDDPLLALRLDADGTHVAYATRSALGTVRLSDAHVERWALPVAIDDVAALSVDRRHRPVLVAAGSGTVFQVVDDGATARVAASPLIEPPEAVVAWIGDGDDRILWTTRRLVDGQARLREAQLASPGASTIRHAVTIAAGRSGDGTPEVHAVAALPGRRLVYVGDSTGWSDQAALIDEQQLTIADDGSSATQVVDAAKVGRNGPDYAYSVRRVDAVLADLGAGRTLVRIDGRIAAVDRGGVRDEGPAGLAEGRRVDGERGYRIRIRRGEDLLAEACLEASPPRCVSFPIPWPHRDPPTVASISPSAQQLVVGSASGAVVTIDLAVLVAAGP